MRKTRKGSPTESADWLREFVTGLSKTDLSPKTVDGYRQDLELFQRWLEGVHGEAVSLEKLSAIDIISYREHLVKAERRKPATINRRLQAIRRLCQWAKRKGILDADPSQEVKTIRVSARRQPLGLKQTEIHALLRVAGESHHANRNYALIQLLLQTGLRISEAASLCIDDLTIRARTGEVRVRQGKGRKEREVPLNATARRAIGDYFTTRDNAGPGAPVFESERCTRMSVRSLQSTITGLARRAKITRLRVSPHTLRHTFALHYLRQNPGKLIELANLLGHESLDATAIYTQPSREELADDLEQSSLNVYG